MQRDLKELATEALRLADAASATPWRRGEAHAHDRHLSADEYGIAWVGTACDRLDAPGYNFEVRQRNGQRDGDFIAFSREALPALARGYLDLLAELAEERYTVEYGLKQHANTKADRDRAVAEARRLREAEAQRREADLALAREVSDHLRSRDQLYAARAALRVATDALRWYADRGNWYERRNDEGDIEGWDCLDGPPGNSFPETGERARAILADPVVAAALEGKTDG